ncbi:MAG: hypothetical protein NWE96_04640 [Candidatus Bathyarchaeota archaeon]|nr:hypothetical protein [Candidatus Bathyarchaeota archaeon]
MGKQKLFLSSIIVFLMFSSIYLYTTPKAQATEISATQKGLSILVDVLGLNLEKYRITSTERQDSFLGVIPEEKVQYTFNSSTSNLKFLCTFTNDQLVILHVLEKEGIPIMTKSIDNLLEATKDFLTTYQQYSGNTLYGELRSMLEKVDTLKNSTITSGSTKLEVTDSETIKGFTWSYTYNGINASSKCVIISYENGFLKYFIDTWNLYNIGSTDINLSEEEAVEIAYENAEKYSWEVNIDNTTKIEINNFNLTDVAVKQLIFCNSHNADNPRTTDTLMLFPMWRIGINLDKFYPGNVYGIYVDIWADTKQVRDIEEVFTTLDPEFFSTLGAPHEVASIEESAIEESQSSSPLSTAAFLLFPIMFLFGVAGILLFLRTKELYFLSNKRSYKIFALFICFLMFFFIVASSVSPTDASMYKGRATTWGSLAPYKTSGELEHQDLICGIIKGRFDANGYTSLDLQGPSSNKNYFLNRIAFDEDLSYRHATVWFDHGIGEGLNFPDHPNEWHFMLCDSNNDKIYDYEISEKTQGRTKFALINTCLSAKIDLNWLSHWPADPDGDGLLGNGYYGNDPRNAKPIGMPYAFTHVANLDTTGYETPDTSSSFCYIGFSAGSASLVQAIDPAIPSIKYYDWIWEFFNSSLNFDLTIKDALDDASQSCYPNIAGFGGTKLHTGFTSVWAGSPIYYGDHDKMAVYGNTSSNCTSQH